MDNFYVILPSNVKSFEDNTIANYKTKLPTRIILTDDWEVGLVEISYTLSWYNSPKEEKIALNWWENGMAKRTTTDVNIPPGRYDTIQDLIELINQKILSFRLTFDSNPQLSVEERDRMVSLRLGTLNNKRVFLELSENLCEMLGFNYKKMIAFNGTENIKYGQFESAEIKKGNLQFQHPEPTEEQLIYNAQRPYELNGGIHSIFIYSDIVSPSFVGDSYTQILRIVEIPTSAKYGDQILISYPNTYYIPVMKKEFDTIEIHAQDDSGMSIPYEYGRMYNILHFRKVNKKI